MKINTNKFFLSKTGPDSVNILHELLDIRLLGRNSGVTVLSLSLPDSLMRFEGVSELSLSAGALREAFALLAVSADFVVVL